MLEVLKIGIGVLPGGRPVVCVLLVRAGWVMRYSLIANGPLLRESQWFKRGSRGPYRPMHRLRPFDYFVDACMYAQAIEGFRLVHVAGPLCCGCVSTARGHHSNYRRPAALVLGISFCLWFGGRKSVLCLREAKQRLRYSRLCVCACRAM